MIVLTAHDLQVLKSDYEVQKVLAPFLKSPSLRKVIQTFVNDENGDFGKWAANPVVIQMLGQAKKLLEEGTITEQEMQDTFSSYLQVNADMPSSCMLYCGQHGASFSSHALPFGRPRPPATNSTVSSQLYEALYG